MELTLEFIETNFDIFNKTYWNGMLRKPEFEIINTKSILGEFCYSNNLWKIRVSNKYARSKTDYQNTILHEMIHLYIRQFKINDSRRHHGKAFYAEADRLNAFGWHISRCDDMKGIGLTDNSNNETFYMAAFRDRDSKYFLFGMNKKKISFFQKKLKLYPQYYNDVIFFSSKDDKKYASYPKCICAIRGRFITKEEYEMLKKC